MISLHFVGEQLTVFTIYIYINRYNFDQFNLFENELVPLYEYTENITYLHIHIGMYVDIDDAIESKFHL